MAVMLLVQGTVGSAGPADDEFEDEGVYRGRPGLVATWSDQTRRISRSESRLAVRLEPGQSPHPAIAGDAFHGRWQGTLNVTRPGRYRFAAEVLGAFSLTVDGTVVLDVRSTPTGGPMPESSEVIELAYGPHALDAKYDSLPGRRAQLKVSWQGDDGVREPIPASALVHDESHESPLWNRWQQVEQGREVVARHACVRCHESDPRRLAGLMISPDESPRLDGIGGRRYQAWLYHWLLRPGRFRARASMPRLFDDTDADSVDLFAAAAFLANDGGPLDRGDEGQDPQTPGPEPAAAADTQSGGEDRLARIGCIACHASLSEPADAPGELRTIDGMGSKTDRRGIVAWLKNPRQFHPGTRMPDFEFSTHQSEHLGVLVDYLASSRREEFEQLPPPPSRNDVLARLEAVPATSSGDASVDDLELPQLLNRLGQAVVESRGCLACHRMGELKNRAKAGPELDALIGRAKSGHGDLGCLAATPVRGVPDYAFDRAQREAIDAFFSEGADGPISNAPAVAGEIRLERSGCLACHQRNGRGGLFGERITRFVRLEQGAQISDLSAPDLSGVGEKLNADWMHKVIVEGQRARPWMDLKMPLFDPLQVRGLTEQLIRADGEDPRKRPERGGETAEADAEAGRLLVGRLAMNCVGCHDVLGHRSLGVRGPDLAGIVERIRPDWFRRWMVDPQRIAAGTRMPSYFYGGRSSVPQYLNGDVNRQIAALWDYFSLGDRMPLPQLDAVPKPTVAGGETDHPVPAGRPMAVHGFMVGHAGLRGVALGYPAGTHFAFDAGACRLARVWTGPFIAHGGWFDAGRGPAEKDGLQILGDIVWRGPERGLIAVSPAENPTGLPLVPQEPYRYRFNAHWTTSSDGGFLYRFETDVGHRMTVEERPAPLKDGNPPAFVRRLAIGNPPADRDLWICLHAGVASASDVALYEQHLARTALATDARGLISVPAEPPQWLRAGSESGDWFVAVTDAPHGATWTVAPEEYQPEAEQHEIRPGQLWLHVPSSRKQGDMNIAVVFVRGSQEDEDLKQSLPELNALLPRPVPHSSE